MPVCLLVNEMQHIRTHRPIVRQVLLTPDPGDKAGTGGVKQKGQRMCVCMTGAGLFFCHLKRTLSPLAGSDCSGRLGGVRAHTSCTKTAYTHTHIHRPAQLCFPTDKISLSLECDLCHHYKQTLPPVETQTTEGDHTLERITL